MQAHKQLRSTIVRLLSNMGSAKEIQQYLKRFSQLDAARFAVVKVGGAVLRDDLDNLVSSLAFLQQVGLTPIVIHGFGRGLAALELLPDLLRRMTWNADAMRAAIDPAMYATDVAIEQAVAGVPFREAYRRAAETSDAGAGARTPEGSLEARASPGGAGDLRLDELRERLNALDE